MAFLKTSIDASVTTCSECSLRQNIIPSSFMTSVRSSFLCLPLTSDEIKNVVRLSPRRNGKSTTNPVQFAARFLPRLRKHIGPEPPPGSGKKRPYPLASREHDDEYFSYHRTPPNHLGFPSHPPERENDPAGAVKNSREGRSVSYLTQLDSGAMINSLLPENYRTSRFEKFNFDYSRILLNKRKSDV